MNKENAICAKDEERPVRITRARAKVLGSVAGISPSSRPPFKQEQRRVLRANSKRAASDENKASMVATPSLQHKRRAVLVDVTNTGENPHDKASKFQVSINGLAYLVIECKF